MKTWAKSALALTLAVSVGAGIFAYQQRRCRYQDLHGVYYWRTSEYVDGQRLTTEQMENAAGEIATPPIAFDSAAEWPGVNIVNSTSYVRCGVAQKDAEAIWFAEVRDPAFAERIASHELVWDANGAALWVRHGQEASAAAARVPFRHGRDRRVYLLEMKRRFGNLRPGWFPAEAWNAEKLIGWYVEGLLFEGGGDGHYYWISSRL